MQIFDPQPTNASSNGMWKWIVVDDYVPVDENLRPVMARARNPNEVWPILIEKCIAKLHGSYQYMAGHSTHCMRIGPVIRCLTVIR